jgi:hypothetical protein
LSKPRAFVEHESRGVPGRRCGVPLLVDSVPASPTFKKTKKICQPDVATLFIAPVSNLKQF